MSEDEEIAAFLAEVDRLIARAPRLDPLQAALLAAAASGLPSDSRSLSRRLGLEHALVLRAIQQLQQAPPLIRITREDPRTMRRWFELTEEGIFVSEA
ncbi:hypothetical protein [Rhizobium sp. FKL33]|uniref:hypothetical protein n=1 Tax=Rhizobium sp. FKL33 TaxID=2562307 RepID=UPI0010BF9820|nr:hypothetical protein [Rhizobium sp. FKL33]